MIGLETAFSLAVTNLSGDLSLKKIIEKMKEMVVNYKPTENTP